MFNAQKPRIGMNAETRPQSGIEKERRKNADADETKAKDIKNPATSNRCYSHNEYRRQASSKKRRNSSVSYNATDEVSLIHFPTESRKTFCRKAPRCFLAQPQNGMSVRKGTEKSPGPFRIRTPELRLQVLRPHRRVLENGRHTRQKACRILFPGPHDNAAGGLLPEFP